MIVRAGEYIATFFDQDKGTLVGGDESRFAEIRKMVYSMVDAELRTEGPRQIGVIF